MTDAVAWGLIHFLWQGAILAALAWGLMRLSPSPSTRYLIGLTTMVAMVAAIAFTVASQARPDAATAASLPAGVAPHDIVLSVDDPAVDTSSHPPRGAFSLPSSVVVAIWAFGVCLLSMRMFGGWLLTRRVAHDGLAHAAADLERLASRVQQNLSVRRLVRIAASSRVVTPVLVGWLRPVILIPPAALGGLTPAQLESILAHEFAHIRRHDYLVNLVQTMVETLLFFHPCVWWLSRQIRRERELCCDDLAVGLCDRLTYATALAALARVHTPSLALAATDGSLRDRISRIVTTSPSSDTSKGGWMAMLPIVLVVSLATPSALTQEVVRPAVVPVSVSPAPAAPQEAASPVRPVPAEQSPFVRLAAPRPAPESALTVQAERITFEGVEYLSNHVQPDPAVEQLLDQQVEIEHRKLAIARSRLENDAALELRRLELELGASQKGFAELRAKVEAGSANQTQLHNYEYSLELQMARLRSAKRDLELSLAELEVRGQEIELRQRALRAGLEQELRRLTEETGEKTLAEADTIRPGDRLTVLIAGESELPRSFTVGPAGTIRYPLLGTIRVQGSTTGQIQTVLVKLLTDRALVDNPSVTVTAVR